MAGISNSAAAAAAAAAASASGARYIRVYHSDLKAFTTVPANPSTTARELCDIISRKSKTPIPAQHRNARFHLYICDSSDQRTFERRLHDFELPLQIQETLQRHNPDSPTAQSLRFVIRARRRQAARGRFLVSSRRPPELQLLPLDVDDPDSGIDSDEEPLVDLGLSLQQPQAAAFVEIDAFCDNLEIRQHGHWKQRWVCLRGNVLRLFKSNLHPSHIAEISVADSVIAVHGGDNVPTARGLTMAAQAPQPPQQYCFELSSPERVLAFRSPSQQALEAWVTRLQAASSLHPELARIQVLQQAIQAEARHESSLEEARMERLLVLSGVLADMSGLSHFMQYVLDNHCEENLLFWLDAEYYRRVPDQGQLAGLRQRIFDRYVQTGARYEIALDSGWRARIAQTLEAGEADPQRELFADHQQRTYMLLQNHTFKSFLQTSHFQRMLLGLSARKGLRQLLKLPYRRLLSTAVSPSGSGLKRVNKQLQQLLPAGEVAAAGQPPGGLADQAGGGDSVVARMQANHTLLDAAAYLDILSAVPSDTFLLPNALV